MTKWRAVAHLGIDGGDGQNQHKQQPTRFRLPTFPSTPSASCAVQKAVIQLIWTALKKYRPSLRRNRLLITCMRMVLSVESVLRRTYPVAIPETNA
jgi:hypothetical protein